LGSPAGASGTGTGSTANVYTPAFQPQADTTLQGLFKMLETGGAAQKYAEAGAPMLEAAGTQLYNTAFDPQSALFRRTQQQVMDQSNVANAAAGVGNTPYGASVTSNALGTFDTNWQNQQLQRELSGGAGASNLLQAAPQLMAALPQQAINDLETYLGLGQSASQTSGQLGQMGFNQLSQGIGGGISALGGIGSLFGLGGGGGGMGS
jgi:hypothetical protein